VGRRRGACGGRHRGAELEQLGFTETADREGQRAERPGGARRLDRAAIAGQGVAQQRDRLVDRGTLVDLVHETAEAAEPHGVDQEVQLAARCGALGQEVVKGGPERLRILEHSRPRALDQARQLVMDPHVCEAWHLLRPREAELGFSGLPHR